MNKTNWTFEITDNPYFVHVTVFNCDQTLTIKLLNIKQIHFKHTNLLCVWIFKYFILLMIYGFTSNDMVLRLTRYLTSGLTDEALRLQASYKSTTIKLCNSNHLSQMLADEAKSCIEFYASLRILHVNSKNGILQEYSALLNLVI